MTTLCKRKDVDDGYRALWSHVILCAIRDCNSVSHHLPAKAWLYSRRTDIGSLRWICDNLELPYEDIQQMSLTREGRAKLLFGID